MHHLQNNPLNKIPWLFLQKLTHHPCFTFFQLIFISIFNRFINHTRIIKQITRTQPNHIIQMMIQIQSLFSIKVLLLFIWFIIKPKYSYLLVLPILINDIIIYKSTNNINHFQMFNLPKKKSLYQIFLEFFVSLTSKWMNLPILLDIII